MVQAVAADIDDGGEGDLDFKVGRGDTGDQPIEFSVVREAEDEFVNDAVDGYGPADELEGGVGRVVEDEVVPVEVG